MKYNYDNRNRQFITELPVSAYYLKSLPGVKRESWKSNIYRIPEIYYKQIPGFKFNPLTCQQRIKFNLPGIIPHDYQVEGSNIIAENNNVLLADEMGLGKTLQILMAFWIRKQRGLTEKLIVFCPKMAKKSKVWEGQIEKYSGYTVKKNDNHYFIINYHQINTEKGFRRLINFIDNTPSEKIMINFDEVHNLSNNKTVIGEKIYNFLNGKNYHVSATSGTPVRNRILSFYGVYKLLTGCNINYFTYEKFFWDEIRKIPKNISVFQEIFKSFSVRRTKKDIRLQEPDTRINPVLIVMDKETRVKYDSYISMVKQAKIENRNQLLGFMQKKITLCGHPIVWDKQFKPTETGKLEALDQLVYNSNEPIAIWSKHPSLLQLLKTRYQEFNPVIIAEEKQGLSKFLNNPESKIALLSLGSCNSALDGLQDKVSTAIYHDLSWKQVDYIQANGRIARQGQRNIVNFYYLVYEHSIDQVIWDRIHLKLSESELLYGSQENVLDTISEKDLFTMIVNH